MQRINFIPNGYLNESYSEEQFAQDILSGIGLAPTPARMRFMLAWFKAEGMQSNAKDVAFNPLATTWQMPGSTFYNCLKKDANGNCLVGVQNFPDYNTGLQATIKTLNQSFYTNIRNALANDVGRLPENDPGLEHDFSTWGTTYTLFKKTFAAQGGVVAPGAAPVPGSGKKGNFNIQPILQMFSLLGVLITIDNTFPNEKK